jgi:LysR family glycine cleavage system transcriptional activator
VFEACGRHRSFVKAALELAITPGAVSQQIKALEEELGVELFRRKARGVEFTPQGEQYYIDVRRSFDILDDATRRVRRGEGLTEITLSIEASLALNWLTPRLPDFNRRYPHIAVTVAARPLARSTASPYSDIAIAYGQRSYAGLKVEQLMSETLMPVCSPEFLARTGPFDGPDWFRRVPLVHDRTFGVDQILPNWQCWFETAGFQEVPSEGGVGFTSSAICMAYAASGGGLALARSCIAEPLMAEGKLINPTGMAMTAPAAYYLVGSPVLIETPAVRIFVDWLFETARDHQNAPANQATSVPVVA